MHTPRGAAVEVRTASELLARGHRVAFPYGDGSSPVDLIVNYRITAQVKSSTVRNRDRLVVNLATRGHGRSGEPDFKDVDVLVAYASDRDEWWCIPIAAVDSRTNLRLGGDKYARWRDAWHVFDVDTEPGSEKALAGTHSDTPDGYLVLRPFGGGATERRAP